MAKKAKSQVRYKVEPLRAPDPASFRPIVKKKNSKTEWVKYRVDSEVVREYQAKEWWTTGLSSDG